MAPFALASFSQTSQCLQVSRVGLTEMESAVTPSSADAGDLQAPALPLDLQVRVSRLSLCRSANDTLLRHQLPTELQEDRRCQSLGEDVRGVVCKT